MKRAQKMHYHRLERNPMSLQQLLSSILTEPLLTRKDLARRYRVSVDTIDDWRRDGTIPQPVYVGRFPYWRPNEIHDMEESNRGHDAIAQS